LPVYFTTYWATTPPKKEATGEIFVVANREIFLIILASIDSKLNNPYS